MLTAGDAALLTTKARARVARRDDLPEVDSLIRMRADAGWSTLTLMPFSLDRARAHAVADVLVNNGYNAVVTEKGAAFGLEISWFSPWP